MANKARYIGMDPSYLASWQARARKSRESQIGQPSEPQEPPAPKTQECSCSSNRLATEFCRSICALCGR